MGTISQHARFDSCAGMLAVRCFASCCPIPARSSTREAVRHTQRGLSHTFWKECCALLDTGEKGGVRARSASEKMLDCARRLRRNVQLRHEHTPGVARGGLSSPAEHLATEGQAVASRAAAIFRACSCRSTSRRAVVAMDASRAARPPASVWGRHAAPAVRFRRAPRARV